MLDYIGIKCPVCGVPFQAEDDIVVCPECGAPYHRVCFEKEGACKFTEELHKEGKSWMPPAPEKSSDPRAEIKDQECPACGLLNSHSALFCNRCGASLSGEPQTHRNDAQSIPHEQGKTPPPFYSAPFSPSPGAFGGMPYSTDPMGGVSPTEFLETDVTFGDVSKLVKQNTAYYMPVFRYMRQRKRNKFNFCAFLFSGAWMLYRKQYKYGIILTALIFALYIGYLCLYLFLAVPTLLELANQLGIELTALQSPTSQQMASIMAYIADHPSLYFQIASPFLCLIGMLAVMIFTGVRGNKMYMKHCIRTVQNVKSTAGRTGEAAGAMLAEKGGVNVPVAVCLFICYLIVVNIPLLL